MAVLVVSATMRGIELLREDEKDIWWNENIFNICQIIK
jgi:hypothetical protein